MNDVAVSLVPELRRREIGGQEHYSPLAQERLDGAHTRALGVTGGHSGFSFADARELDGRVKPGHDDEGLSKASMA